MEFWMSRFIVCKSLRVLLGELFNVVFPMCKVPGGPNWIVSSVAAALQLSPSRTVYHYSINSQWKFCFHWIYSSQYYIRLHAVRLIISTLVFLPNCSSPFSLLYPSTSPCSAAIVLLTFLGNEFLLLSLLFSRSESIYCRATRDASSQEVAIGGFSSMSCPIKSCPSCHIILDSNQEFN